MKCEDLVGLLGPSIIASSLLCLATIVAHAVATRQVPSELRARYGWSVLWVSLPGQRWRDVIQTPDQGVIVRYRRSARLASLPLLPCLVLEGLFLLLAAWSCKG